MEACADAEAAAGSGCADSVAASVAATETEFRHPHYPRGLLRSRRKLFRSHRKSTAGADDEDGGCGARRATFADDADGARGCTRAADVHAEAAAPILRVQLAVCARWATVAEAEDGARGAPSAFPKALPQPQT